MKHHNNVTKKGGKKTKMKKKKRKINHNVWLAVMKQIMENMFSYFFYVITSLLDYYILSKKKKGKKLAKTKPFAPFENTALNTTTTLYKIMLSMRKLLWTHGVAILVHHKNIGKEHGKKTKKE